MFYSTSLNFMMCLKLITIRMLIIDNDIIIWHHCSFRFCTVLEFVSGNDLDFLLKQNKNLPEKEVNIFLVNNN